MKKFGLAAVTTLALASASYLALAGSSYAADMMLKSPAMEAAQPVSGYIELYSGWGNTTIKGDEGYRLVNRHDSWCWAASRTKLAWLPLVRPMGGGLQQGDGVMKLLCHLFSRLCWD